MSIELQNPQSQPAAPPSEQKCPHPESSSTDPYLVVFDQPFDASNPLQWSPGRKWTVTTILSATGFNRIVVSTIMAPALPAMAAELAMSPTQAALSLSIYLLATAFGPLVMGPLSEMYGRQVVLHASNVWFVAFNLLCGFATSKEVLIAARLFTGLGASAIYSLGGGVLGDVWSAEQRGKSLGTYLAIPLVAVAVGPIIGGVITARADWRWMFWATSVFQGVSIVVCCFTFHETSAEVILRRRAARLRRTTGDKQYVTLTERLDRDLPVATVLRRALGRPLHLLAFNPVIQLTSVISALNYGLLYVVLSSFADVVTSQYGLSTELSGLHYIAVALGEMAGSQLGGWLMDAHYRRCVRRGDTAPETRLPLVYVPALLAPLGLIVYGWSAEYRVHWIAVDIGVFVFSFGLQVSGMPVQAYLIDVCGEFTSSALSANQFLRSLTAFLFPLFAPSLYKALGYGWGNVTIGLVGTLLGVGATWLLWMFGARMRTRVAQ